MPARRAPDPDAVRTTVSAVLRELDRAAELDAETLRAAVRGLADLLAAAAPGQCVELRIPGPAGLAVQCVEGPRHTRGTPGNVVETDPITFVELGVGRLTWAGAVATGRVRASGARADLAPYLPLFQV